MIGLATLSLLAACPHSAEGLPVSPQRPPATAGAATGPGDVDAIADVPKQAGAWTRAEPPRRITEDTIFDYMDGAGELYLAYRFEHLDVHVFTAPEKALGEIRVELYWMKSADDAFGLLSVDWGGEAVELRGPGSRPRATSSSVPPHDALYGGGLLRFWNGRLYGRVMASRESAASRAQVLAIAQSIVKDRPAENRPPDALSKLPARLGDRLVLRPDRTCFFRSHYVLNSVYYLSPHDVLGLGPDVEATVSEYRAEAAAGSPVRLIQVAYPNADRSAAALESFRKASLPAQEGERPSTPVPAAAKGEGGWMGWAAADRFIAIVLGAQGEGEAKALASTALAALAGQ